MISRHRIVFKNSQKMRALSPESVDLVVTSPPYPMIEMWDEIFSKQSQRVRNALKKNDGPAAFEGMHRQLDKVWDELARVLKPGGIACINIGDATRTINEHFALYTNHSRILSHMQTIGFSALPTILWRKQTNAPNKFMGSGMLPPGAYVTLEHEYVLILRKGAKREFSLIDEKKNRRQSAYFWEERNQWFSDVWMDLKGTTQNLVDNKARNRSGAFPFELPYRLINMFSVKGDLVLDPFLGLGTTMFAAMAAGRNSVGYEIDSHLQESILPQSNDIVNLANRRISMRLEAHLEFVKERFQKKGKFKYTNAHYLFPVITSQEKEMLLNQLESVSPSEKDVLKVTYSDTPQKDFCDNWEEYILSASDLKKMKKPKGRKKKKVIPKQQQLF
jgi:DNA modification methylase